MSPACFEYLQPSVQSNHEHTLHRPQEENNGERERKRLQLAFLTMPRPSSNLRVGATVAVRKRALFGEGKDALPTDEGDSVRDLRVLAFMTKAVSQRDTLCVVLSHPRATGSVFYCAAGSTRLLQPAEAPAGGSSDNDDDDDDDDTAMAAAASGDEDDGDGMLPSLDEVEDEEVSDDASSGSEEDGDDAGPPSPHLKAASGTAYEYNSVSTALEIPHGIALPPRCSPRWNHGNDDDAADDETTDAAAVSPAAAFIALFPAAVLDRLVAATSAQLAATGDKAVSKKEMLAIIAGVAMVGALHPSVPRASLFTPSTDPLFPRPDLSQYISRQRVERVLSALTLSTTQPPPYRDPLFHVREMQRSFNEHMEKVFTPGTVTCLSESVVAYHSDDAPAWAFAGRRPPHPHGFAYHTMTDETTAVVFRLELVEGRHQPPQDAPPTPRGSMAVRLDRLTAPLRGRGHIVVLDAASCELDGLVDLAKKGVYAAAVVRKRKCWPRHVPGEDILAYMKDKPVGELHVAQGTLEGVKLNFNCVRHSRYTFVLVSTYGSHNLLESPLKLWAPSGGSFAVQRNQVLSDYYAARHAVDDNRRSRQGAAGGLEQAWGARDWEMRHLAFLVALCEANALRAYNHFVVAKRAAGRPGETLCDFRRNIVKGLFEALGPAPQSQSQTQPQSQPQSQSQPQPRAPRTVSGEHVLVKVPKGKGMWNPATGRYNDTKQVYQKLGCRGGINPRTGLRCTAKIRTVCACTPGLYLCRDCIIKHAREEEESGCI